MITHLEPDMLECKVKWALGNITKMRMLKCHTQYASKFGGLIIGQRTGKH